MKNLRKAVKELNESGLFKKEINIVGKKKDEAIEIFMNAVESIPEKLEDEIPEFVIDTYNDFADRKEDIEKNNEEIEDIVAEAEDSDDETGEEIKKVVSPYIREYSAIDAIIEIGADTEIDKLVAKADEIYSKVTGRESNLSQSCKIVKVILKVYNYLVAVKKND